MLQIIIKRMAKICLVERNAKLKATYLLCDQDYYFMGLDITEAITVIICNQNCHVIAFDTFFGYHLFLNYTNLIINPC